MKAWWSALGCKSVGDVEGGALIVPGGGEVGDDLAVKFVAESFAVVEREGVWPAGVLAGLVAVAGDPVQSLGELGQAR